MMGNQSVIVFYPRASLSLQTQHSPLYPLLSLPFRIFIQSIYYNVLYYLIPSAANLLPVYREHPSGGSSFLASGPANFFSSSLSVPALLFVLPLFPAQLHFYFVCPFYTLHPSPFPLLKFSSRFWSFCRSF